MRKLAFILSIVIVLALTTFSNATLYDRGGGLIYDDVLNVTWLQDANYAKTSGYDADGLLMWDMAMVWADGLVYQGYDDWRLPTGMRFTDQNEGELKQLYLELENIPDSPFINLMLDTLYWTSTSRNDDPSDVLKAHVAFINGYQAHDHSVSWNYALPVRNGDSAPVPIPAAFWLLGSGLIGLIGLRRKFKK